MIHLLLDKVIGLWLHFSQLYIEGYYELNSQSIVLFYKLYKSIFFIKIK